MPDSAPPRGCLWWNGHGYELACVDDLCHGSSTTLCGLEEGHDFGVEEDFDDDWDDDPSDDYLPVPAVGIGPEGDT